MLDEFEARSRILAAATPAAAEAVPLRDALGAYAAEDIAAKLALPGFDNSQVDGYAVRAREAFHGARLNISGKQPAGANRGLTVSHGEAIRIFTGAPIPNEVDAVVMQEDTEIFSKGRIRIREGVDEGDFIRRKGSDLCVGQKILQHGDLLTPSRVGVLASQGMTEVNVRQPRVAVVTTGDELVNPGGELPDGAIFNSNGPMLASAVHKLGVTRVTERHAPDETKKLTETLEAALGDSDVCIIAGGVSVGEHDLVKGVLGKLGVDGGFWRVRVKPGKPLFFGKKGDRLVFGLPGNPVSAYITFQLFVRPALLRVAGAKIPDEAPPLPTRDADLTDEVVNDRGNRPHYVRGWFDETAETFRPVGLQQSHALYGMSRTNALVRVDVDEKLPARTHVKCLLMD
ncbi:MAG: molybdopterin molybdotransferase [Verrucomicrobiales bacterium]|jgi:molybdopterin molybdotransferase